MATSCRSVRSMMKTIAACGVILGGLLALLIPGMARTNCGGNSAALADVRTYQAALAVLAAASPEHRADLADATGELRDTLDRIAGDFWIRPARFLAAPDPSGPASVSADSRPVILVCTRAYRNVPRHVLGWTPATHAAAFADGTCGLISVAEYAALDKSRLVPLDELLAASPP